MQDGRQRHWRNASFGAWTVRWRASRGRCGCHFSKGMQTQAGWEHDILEVDANVDQSGCDQALTLTKLVQLNGEWG